MIKNLTSLGIIYYGELINSKEFNRPAYFIYFDVLFKASGTNVKLDNIELTNYIWVDPDKALEMNLGESYNMVIKAYINFKKKCFT